jgi:hypothetical protein
MGHPTADELTDALILSALASGPMHGYAISECIVPSGEERDLYAALHRLEFNGALTSEWGVGEDGRRAKYYRLREAHASRPELAWEALALVVIMGAAASRAATPMQESGGCIAAIAPVSFSGRIGSVRVFVDGDPATFVIDTASDTIVNSDRLHLAVLHTLTASTVTTSGSAPVEWNEVRLRQFSVGGREIKKRTVLAKSLAGIEAALGQQVDGILGNDVFNQWGAVTLDYKNRKLALECSGENRDER